ncbi:lipopolysaccharide biosynthesis protein [Desulfovibrio litoralis]|uniref:Membrane protein involved in the export of O-antigen and teichoic acid n=1 Tax=Desulfovibrio litoralis DSM 11393 TaxID=1121455 RepID=A0A1M7TCP2_9BACT|nr:oligosaccharide flippase family protein [Desulfovibrio litoralis]SHN68514.1 Membrane protein involved in the export of O-antigen and teichoic acid [Desulfovibrio litoralis DSM 11393]
MKESSLAKRYVFKLIANFAAIPIYLVMEALLPRALGPASYGNFNFITAQFLQATTFLDMGSSTCLSISMSKRPYEFGLPSFYLRISFFVFLLTLGLGFLCLYPPVGVLVLPDVPLYLAPLGALWAYLTWTGRILRGMNDALGITVSSETVRMSFSMIGAVTLFLLYLSGILSLSVLFIQQYLFLFLPALGYALVMRKFWSNNAKNNANNNTNNNTNSNTSTTQTEEIQTTRSVFYLDKTAQKNYAKEFWHYSHPLFILALISALSLGGERWLLQFFSGSEAQGYFSLGQKVGMACFLFVSAMVPLFMRELSKAHGENNYQAMGALLDRYAPILYAVAALLSAFACIEGIFLTKLFGGEKFLAAGPAVQLMALYPVHQAYGQLAGAVFHASSETRTLRNVSVVFMFFGLILAFYLLAPKDNSESTNVFFQHFSGLGLGAYGLALKTIGVQILSVTTLLWVCSRKVPFNFKRNLLHQVVSLSTFLTIALIAKQSSLTLLGFFSTFNSEPIRFILSGFIYLILNCVFIFIFPFLIGLNKTDLNKIFHKIKQFF